MPTRPLTSFSAIPKQSGPIQPGSADLPVQSDVTWRKWLKMLLGALLLGGVLFLVWQRFAPKTMDYGILLQSPQRVSNFVLQSADTDELHLDDFAGRYLLVNFGYRSCPDVCPLTLADLADAYDALGAKSDQLQVLFVSVDPKRDTPEKLKGYVTYFHPAFLGATGTEEALSAMATQLGIYHEERSTTDEGNNEGTGKDTNDLTYLVDHTATTLVIDPQGYLRMIFPFGTSGAEMASDLDKLIY